MYKQNFLMRNKQHWAFGLEAVAEFFWHWLGFSVAFLVLVVLSAVSLVSSASLLVGFLSSKVRLLFIQTNPIVGDAVYRFLDTGSPWALLTILVALVLSVAVFVYGLSLSVALIHFANRRLHGESGWLFSWATFDIYRAGRLVLLGILMSVLVLWPLLFLIPLLAYKAIFLTAVLGAAYFGYVVYLLLRFLFVGMIVALDDVISIFGALKKSWGLSKGNIRTIFSLTAAYALFNGKNVPGLLMGVVGYPFACLSLLRALEQQQG